MKVTLEFTDDSSLTIEEIVAQATHNYGSGVDVKVEPDSKMPHDWIYFAVQKIITHQQLSYLYDDKHTYHKSIGKLRADTLGKIGEIIDQVIIDNEAKVQ